MERLTADDAAFLELEDRVSAMHNVTVAIFGGDEPPLSDVAARVADRTASVPRFRQRVGSVPLGLHRPVWVDDAEFDVGYHLRHTGLPVGASDGALDTLVGRLLSQRLDRGKPLWELWLVSGLEDGRWALISKAHHALIDGVSGADPLSMVIDQGRHAERPRTWIPRPRPSARRMLADAALQMAFDPAEQIRFVRRYVLDPVRRTVGELAGAEETSRPASLSGAAGPHRRWARAEVDAAVIQRLRDRHAVATNDVVLSLMTLGWRAMLVAEGAAVPDTIRSLVPLATATGDHFGNEMNALEADLPVGAGDFATVVDAIRAQTHHLSGTAKAVAGATLATLPGFVAPTLCGLGLRAATQAGSRLDEVHTVAVNAPGPAEAISMLGRPMVELHPAVPLVARVRVAVGVMSYRDRFGFGVTGDRTAEVRVAALAAGIERAARIADQGGD